jgi:pimeloyl-ACP methyl ester carboxylesterase
MELIRGDGADLAVYRDGDPDRPTVLLVHGYPDTHAVWDDIASALSEHFHVVRYDVRGAGASTHPAGRQHYTFERLMADMRAVLDAVSPDRPVHLAGHDWGSIQGWEAVCTMPERFASFTSISGPSLDHAGRWLRARLARPAPRGLARAAGQGLRSWYIYVFRMPWLPEALWRTVLPRVLRSTRPAAELTRDGIAGLGLYRANMADRLHRPRERGTGVPTLVIVPTRDPFVSPHLVGGLQRRAPRLALRTVQAGHWVIRSHPDLIAGWILDHAAQAHRPLP